MTFEQAVEKVQGIMKDAKREEIGSVAIEVNFTNKDCYGTMYISTREGQLDVQGYDYKDNDASIELMYGDLTKILTGKLSAATAISKGAVIVNGNLDAFSAIAGCAKKPTAKKPATKKAETKPVAKATAKKAETKAATKTAATVKKAEIKTTSKTPATAKKAETKTTSKTPATAKKAETKTGTTK